MSEGARIQKIDKSKLVDTVMEQLDNMIKNGIWKEGDKVPSENQLAREFNVGRGVIREALQGLRSRNMIVTHHGLGSFVCNPENFVDVIENTAPLEITESDYQSIRELRSCLERRAIVLSAGAGTEKDFEKIHDALLEMEKTVGDLDAFTHADLSFHLAVMESSHSGLLIKAYNSCQGEIYFVLREMNRLRESYSYAIKTHKEMYDHIVARQAEKAIDVMEKTEQFNAVRYSSMFKQERG